MIKYEKIDCRKKRKNVKVYVKVYEKNECYFSKYKEFNCALKCL